VAASNSEAARAAERGVLQYLCLQKLDSAVVSMELFYHIHMDLFPSFSLFLANV